MTTQQMPEVFVPVLENLSELSQESYEALGVASAVLDKPSGINDFAEQAGQSTAMTVAEAHALLSMLLWILMRTEASGAELVDLIDELVASEELALEGEDQQRLASRVLGLADRRPARVLHKSLDLMHEHHSVFLDARIVTDIRPVFGGEVSEGMDAVVLTHSLKIDSVEEGQRRSFHTALDQSDLRVLQDVLERAIDKATSLGESLDSAGIPNLTPEE